MRIAISTGGGDAPGLNAVIRAAVLSALDRGWHVLGIRKGYAGLLGDDDVVPLTRDDVRGIGHLGGRAQGAGGLGWNRPNPQPGQTTTGDLDVLESRRKVRQISLSSQPPPGGPRRSFAGGAGLTSTARDYARFLEMIRRGGALDGTRYLSPRSVDLMTTNQIGSRYGDGTGYGLAFSTVDRLGANGFASVGSFNWGGAYASIYNVDPSQRMVTVLMLQNLPGSPEARARFSTLV